jgi:DNA polymerase-3 subunit gamma/tau
VKSGGTLDSMPAYQSLYRRFRPQRFEEVVGQDHVTRTLRNAVREDRVVHAYLFSGPRGTGKTSTARILAKALNCAAPEDGEPCGHCDSCQQVASGASLDVIELDAASNRGIDAMRELVSRVALGTAGRWKVYILDEVHQLTADASTTLLKTLEEPPGHVVFVLATTDPQKVLPTIRSRTQHFEFRLLPADVLLGLLRRVAADAELEVAPEALDLVARRGSGSARDALSALDQVAAAGGIEHEVDPSDEIAEALAERDAARVLAAVAQACNAGRDARQLTRDLVEHLRNGFLAVMGRSLVALPDADAVKVEEQARRMGTARVVRALEALGEAMVEMRDAIDPRITLEVALVRLARPDADISPAALLERIERLERAAGNQSAAPAVAAARQAVADDAPSSPPPAQPQSDPAPSSSARAALGAFEARPRPAPTQDDATIAAPPAVPSHSGPAASLPSRDDLTREWGDTVLGQLPPRARARFKLGRFLDVGAEAATFALPNDIHRQRCEECRADVEDLLAAHFHRRVPLRLVVDPGPAAPAEEDVTEPVDEVVDISQLEDAPAAVTSGIEHLAQAFPGAQLVEE